MTLRRASLALAAFVLAAAAAGGLAGAGPPAAKPAGTEKKAAPATQPAAAAAPGLRDPASLQAKAPATFRARFETSKGTFVVEAIRDWAPARVDRFYNLVKSGFFGEVRFFRVVPGFLVQFGIHGDPAIANAWLRAPMSDEPVKQSNKRGTLAYVRGSAPNSCTTQLFIQLKDNTSLDGQGVAPFARVVEGMEVVDALNSKHGERLTGLQREIYEGGNAFLAARAPDLDYIKKATIVK